jgi:hypothetical protein
VVGINLALNVGGTTHQTNLEISPEQLQELARAVTSGSADQTAKIEELATKLGATQAALLANERLVTTIFLSSVCRMRSPRP